MPESWREEFWWSGTRDLSPYLAVPTAIEFMQDAGLGAFRQQTHALAVDARERICRATGLQPFLSDRDDWFGSMIPMPLPDCDTYRLQAELWRQYKIETPMYRWQDQPIVRVSCHWYNDREQVDYLAEALEKLLA